MKLESAFAKELYHARTAAGYSQKQISHAAGISLRWYQCLERGLDMPGPKTMLRLMQLLAIDPQDMREASGITGWLTFRAVEQHRYSPETGHYRTYGICVFSRYSKTYQIDDVSCDAGFVDKLIRQCTLLQVSPEQLYDVVLDALV